MARDSVMNIWFMLVALVGKGRVVPSVAAVAMVPPQASPSRRKRSVRCVRLRGCVGAAPLLTMLTAKFPVSRDSGCGGSAGTVLQGTLVNGEKTDKDWRISAVLAR